MKTRIYVVEVQDKARLVRAPNQSQARGHVVKDSVKVRLASQDDLIAMREIEVETAGEE